MKKEKRKKIDYKTIFTIPFILIIIVALGYFFYIAVYDEFRDVKVADYSGTTSHYYSEPKIIDNYKEYKDEINNLKNGGWTDIKDKYDKEFFDEKSLVSVQAIESGLFHPEKYKSDVKDVSVIGKTVYIKLYINPNKIASVADVAGNTFYIPVSKKVEEINVKAVYPSTILETLHYLAIIILPSLLIIYLIKRKRKEKDSKLKHVLKSIGILLFAFALIFAFEAFLASNTHYPDITSTASE